MCTPIFIFYCIFSNIYSKNKLNNVIKNKNINKT